MTEQEKQEFFEKVKGKKIRWKGIPETTEIYTPIRFLDDYMYSDAEGGRAFVNILNGFNIFKDQTSSGEIEGHWELVEEQNTIPEQTIPSAKKCTCNSRDLFNFGCKCGGV